MHLENLMKKEFFAISFLILLSIIFSSCSPTKKVIKEEKAKIKVVENQFRS